MLLVLFDVSGSGVVADEAVALLANGPVADAGTLTETAMVTVEPAAMVPMAQVTV